MKAIIPVAGAGTRLRPHTYTQPKALIPVAGKPILGFIIDQLIAAGIHDFIFVIGYLGEKIKEYVQTKYPSIKAEFVYQVSREGLGHAIWMAKDAVEPKDELFIVLGDTIVDANLKEMIQHPHSTLGIQKVSDPRGFGVAELNEDGRIIRLIEKPKIPKSNMALVGIYRIKESQLLFDALYYHISNNIQTNNEFQLTDALMYMIEMGVTFYGQKVQNWYDLGQKEILLETNSILLKKLNQKENVASRFENTIIIPPVSIAENTQISNSLIGPYVTIGENTSLNYSIIRDSIIGNYVKLDEVVLHHSVIGSDASIRGLSQSLNIGDNTEIDLSGEY